MEKKRSILKFVLQMILSVAIIVVAYKLGDVLRECMMRNNCVYLKRVMNRERKLL